MCLLVFFAAEMESQSEVGGPDDSNVDEKLSSGTIQQSPVRKAMQMDSGAVSEDSPMKSGSERGTRRRTKAQLKEELREKKVQEKQCELRRQRTRNRKYISDDFTSIFTEKKNLLASSGYVDDAKREAENVEEEVVDPNDEAVIIVEDAENVVEECVEVGSSSSSDSDYSPRNRSRRYDSDSDSRPGSPYSDISHSSTVYSISSETSEASSGKHSHSEQSRSAASQPSSQKETSRQSWSPPEARKLPYTRDKYRDGSSPYGRLQNRESESPWRSRHESSYSTSDGRTYSPVKNRPDSRTEIRMYHHESPHALKHPETSPMNTRRRHAYARGHRYCIISSTLTRIIPNGESLLQAGLCFLLVCIRMIWTVCTDLMVQRAVFLAIHDRHNRDILPQSCISHRLLADDHHLLMYYTRATNGMIGVGCLRYCGAKFVVL